MERESKEYHKQFYVFILVQYPGFTDDRSTYNQYREHCLQWRETRILKKCELPV